MDDSDFLKTAEALALKNPNSQLAIDFLLEFRKENADLAKCITIASKLILSLESVAE